jgi:hypothetical protein
MNTLVRLGLVGWWLQKDDVKNGEGGVLLGEKGENLQKYPIQQPHARNSETFLSFAFAKFSPNLRKVNQSYNQVLPPLHYITTSRKHFILCNKQRKIK